VSETFDTLGELLKSGLTVLLVEQNVNQALELAQTGYVLETGRIVLAGPGQDLLSNAKVRAAYLGAGIPYTPPTT
jgi:branched-chain amino acid transport system ATP-binding protein